jgi:hypothetical protein
MACTAEYVGGAVDPIGLRGDGEGVTGAEHARGLEVIVSVTVVVVVTVVLTFTGEAGLENAGFHVSLKALQG